MIKKLVSLISPALLLTALPSQAALIQVSPNAQQVTSGSPATADLNVSGLGSGTAPSLSTFDIDVGFDSGVLAFNNATFGSQVDRSGFGIQSVTPTSGNANLFELSFDSPSTLNSQQPGSFTLANLTFDTLAPSPSTDLTPSVNALGDAFGDPLPRTTSGGSFKVVSQPSPPSTVPLPQTVLLFVTGLGLFLGLFVWQTASVGYIPEES